MIEHTVRKRAIDLEVYYKTKIPRSIFHMHNYYELHLIIEGEMNFFLDSSFYTVTKGDLLLIRDNHIHGPKPTETTQVKRGFIQFSPQYVSKFTSGGSEILDLFEENAGIVHLKEEAFITIRDIILKMHREQWVQSKVGHQHLMDSYFINLIFQTFNYIYSDDNNTTVQSQNNKLLSETVTETTNFIRDKISNPNLSLGMISDELSYNKTYLNRLFKKEMGSSIYQYILINRISLAKNLMKKGASPQECAYSSGFNNYSNFYRAFKKHAEMSPSDYVKNYCTNPRL